MTIGPTLPPHLQKRKRDSGDGDDNAPTRDSSSPDTAEKRRKTLGPSLPPAPLNERPTEPPSNNADTDSDSEDDYGPAIPSGATDSISHIPPAAEVEEAEPEAQPTARDSWMLNPPAQDDLSSRLDPSKIRARKFNTGKAGRPPASGGASGEIDAIWTETPQQKATRLKNSVMGISSSGATAKEAKKEGRSQEDVETARRLEKARQKEKSLFENHQGRKDREEDDDPSKRTFDYQKDVGGVQVGSKQKRELMGKAKEFGSRFSGGSYL